uniref:Uncharacterized protein n=1 Tax=Molossus molossus TaxID=27622 RepID=A0A7J8BN68_MOLMO|nr:hypothetical protein HJG59_010134 [Molossus molossus]
MSTSHVRYLTKHSTFPRPVQSQALLPACPHSHMSRGLSPAPPSVLSPNPSPGTEECLSSVPALRRSVPADAPTDKKLFRQAFCAERREKWQRLLLHRGRLIRPDTEIVINSSLKIMLRFGRLKKEREQKLGVTKKELSENRTEAISLPCSREKINKSKHRDLGAEAHLSVHTGRGTRSQCPTGAYLSRHGISRGNTEGIS